MDKKKIYYLTMEGITSTVFKSQVYELLNSDLCNENNLTLLLMQPINVRWSKKVFKELLKLKMEKNFKVNIIPYIGFKGKVSAFLAKLLLKIRFFCDKFFNKKIVIHCRGQEATVVAINFKNSNENISIISDIRGAIAEELKEVNPKRARYFKELDDIIFNKKIDEITIFNYVSNELYKYYYEYENVGKCEHAVIPCFSSFDNNTNNEKEDDLLNLIYVGGQQFYQNIDKIPCLINKINNKNIKIYMCMNGKKNNYIEKLFSDNNINSEFYYNLNREELNRIYSKSDIGILIRDNLILNKVSSPVKLSEYLSNGLYVLLVGEVGDFYNDINNNSNLGLAFSDLSTIGSIDFDLERIKEYIYERRKYSKKYSKKYCIEKYSELYKKM